MLNQLVRLDDHLVSSMIDLALIIHSPDGSDQLLVRTICDLSIAIWYASKECICYELVWIRGYS
jgi:hypothetical protein